jgi:Family of unknown function (DUF5996)
LPDDEDRLQQTLYDTAGLNMQGGGEKGGDRPSHSQFKTAFDLVANCPPLTESLSAVPRFQGICLPSRFLGNRADRGARMIRLIAATVDDGRASSRPPRFWQTLVQVERVFTRFRGQFLGKVSPVHFFWGSFDMAVTRFSGRTAPQLVSNSPTVLERPADPHGRS